jgi:hypothetical protein
MDALSELADQLRAMYDPLFAAQDASNNLADAQQAVTDAAKANSDGIADNNVSVEEMARLNQAAVRAAVDFQGAMLSLKAGIADGTVQLDTAISTLHAWVGQGLLTEEQAKQAEKEIRALGDTAASTGRQEILIPVDANTQPFHNTIAYMRAAQIAQGISIPVRFNAAMGTQRWGGIHSFAGGGIHAHVAKHEVVRYAEPETGGEAFVPRRGSPSRSTAVLREAAGWYGYGLHRMAQGGVLSYSGGASGGSSWSGGQTIVDMRGATVYGVDDLERKIEGAVDKAHEKTAVKMRKKATY